MTRTLPRIGTYLAVLLAAATWSDTSRADAPAGRFAAVAGVVMDAKTGLSWQQAPGAKATQADATTSCAGLDLAGMGWRLPTMKELETIVDDSRFNPAIDPLFTEAMSQGAVPTWSSSPLSGLEEAYGWYVTFFDGSAWYQYLVEMGEVRCVR